MLNYVFFHLGDIRKEEDIQNALSQCVDNEGKPKLDAVINVAGVANAFKIYNFQTQKPQRLADFQDLLDINVCGTFNVIRLAADLIAKNELNQAGTRGCIVNTSSILAWEGHEGQVGYSASQMAINAMTLPISRDLSQQGIRVNTIAPGFFDTPLVNRGKVPELFEFINCATPCPSRLGFPEEFAALVQSVIENNMLNGEIIRLDGAARWPERG